MKRGSLASLAMARQPQPAPPKFIAMRDDKDAREVVRET
jgi:hypothetical protein